MSTLAALRGFPFDGANGYFELGGAGASSSLADASGYHGGGVTAVERTGTMTNNNRGKNHGE